ncbi:MAG: cytochrome c oxidase assembly protein [Candidatus Sulfotelmatobacter sp.]
MEHIHSAAFSSSLIVALLILTALIYLCGWIRVRRVGVETIAGWHATSFLAGLFCIGIVVASPVAALDHELLTAHMVQHLLLMTVAPAFLLLGAPLFTLLHGLPQTRVKSVAFATFRWARVARLGKLLGQPVFCWIAATATLVAWHVPAFFTIGSQSEIWHVVEHASFFAAGLLFWWPVIRPWPSAEAWPRWSTVLYLFLATLPCDILSGFLVFCDRVVYTAYLSTPQHFGISALEDQQRAGALMWTCVTLVYLLAAAIVAVRLLSVGSAGENEPMPAELSVTVAPHAGQQSVEVV